MSQIPLGIALEDLARFETFLPGANELTLAALRGLEFPGAWLYGPSGSGKSHLLQAYSAATAAPYYSLGMLPSVKAITLSLNTAALILDDVDKVLGQPEWEQELFSIYNQVQQSGGLILLSSATSPVESDFCLADLRSRFQALPVYRLQELSDDERVDALMLRAESRGLTVAKKTLRYMVQRMPRDMTSLYGLLDKLDRYSWETGRAVTVSLLRDYLAAPARDSRESAEKKQQ